MKPTHSISSLSIIKSCHCDFCDYGWENTTLHGILTAQIKLSNTCPKCKMNDAIEWDL